MRGRDASADIRDVILTPWTILSFTGALGGPPRDLEGRYDRHIAVLSVMSATIFGELSAVLQDSADGASWADMDAAAISDGSATYTPATSLVAPRQWKEVDTAKCRRHIRVNYVSALGAIGLVMARIVGAPKRGLPGDMENQYVD